MEKTKLRKSAAIMLMGMLVLFGISILFEYFPCYSKEDKNNIRLLKKDDAYQMDFKCLSITDSHKFDLGGKERIKVKLEVEQGELSVTIKDPNGVIIYSGNGKEIRDFIVGVEERGAYTVIIKTSRATGKIRICIQKN